MMNNERECDCNEHPNVINDRRGLTESDIDEMRKKAFPSLFTRIKNLMPKKRRKSD
jgi:hypothetical protein